MSSRGHDHRIDMRGEVCPYTFVQQVKVSLRGMQPRQLLQIVVDYPPAARQVPRFVRYGGDEVVGVRRENGKDWVITVRRSAELHEAREQQIHPLVTADSLLPPASPCPGAKWKPDGPPATGA
jgi:tRNA 2-thiouridine synthesizing protein A